jgi:hypothetical protein
LWILNVYFTEETCKKQNKDIETESEDGHDEESAAPKYPLF